MEPRETVKKSNKLSKSVGAGMKSLLGKGGRTYYILEHKVNSDKHRAGEHQEIIIDYIELGRDSKCQVRFGDTFPTVSRKHAAISREGNNWVLKNLSDTNPTLINGKPISKQFFLQNGDEIQLSMEGPKLGFLIPVQDSVKSIGMTRRLSLFKQQALLPYKQAIIAISLIFLIAIGIGGFFLWNQNSIINKQIAAIDEMSENITAVEGNADSLRSIISENEASQAKLKNQLAQLQRTVKKRPREETANVSGNQVPNTVDLKPLFSSIYYISVDKIVIEFQGESQEITDYGWSGTGFLLDNNKFITARHVIEAWYFFNENDETDMTLNMIANNGGSVIAYFTAYSPDGSTISFKSTDFNFNRSGDKDLVTTDNDGDKLLLKKASLSNGQDWASFAANKSGVIKANVELSNNLNVQEKLHILGYPLGYGARDADVLSPIYGNCIVSSDGLRNGIIYVTDRNFEHGNSGGPVFALKDGQYYAIGLVSAGTGGSMGFIIPISAVR